MRHLTPRGGGGLYSPPPHYDLENHRINLYYVMGVHFTRCFTQVPFRFF